MQEKFQLLFEKNKELGFEQDKSQSVFPDKVLMIDNISLRQISPQMREIYSYATNWKEAFTGKDLLDPTKISEIYNREEIQQLIELTAENYKPVPPSDKTDWPSTMLFAVESGGLGAVYLWWKDEKIDEPSVVSISGGDIKVFIDLNEFIDFLVYGNFPERGDELYSWFEKTRGTLSS